MARSTADDWIRAWQAGGFEALKPRPRALSPKVPDEFFALAEARRRENPDRTAAHICQIIAAANGWAPNERTLQRHFRLVGLTRRELSARAGDRFGRFEAAKPNELWTGDALHGPIIGRHKAILFAFVDDHSRLFTGYRWVTAKDTVRAEAALRAGLAARGVPQAVYLDNGSLFVSAPLLRACASLGVRLIHSKPAGPKDAGRSNGVFRTVRDLFLVEAGHAAIDDSAPNRADKTTTASGRVRCAYGHIAAAAVRPQGDSAASALRAAKVSPASPCAFHVKRDGRSGKVSGGLPRPESRRAGYQKS